MFAYFSVFLNFLWSNCKLIAQHLQKLAIELCDFLLQPWGLLAFLIWMTLLPKNVKGPHGWAVAWRPGGVFWVVSKVTANSKMSLESCHCTRERTSPATGMCQEIFNGVGCSRPLVQAFGSYVSLLSSYLSVIIFLL